MPAARIRRLWKGKVSVMKKVLNNHLFLWRLCFRTAPGFMLYAIYDAFRNQFLIFLEHTIAVRYVLKCAEYGEPFYKAFIVVGLVLLAYMAAIIPDGYYIHNLSLRAKPKLYQALKEQMYHKAAEIDLECYDEPNYYNEFVLSVSEAENAIERFLALLNSLIQSVTIMLTTGVFFLVTDAAGILFVLASFVLNFLFARVLNKLNYEVRMKTNPLERKRNYVSRIFYLSDYAKELRLYPRTADILEQDFVQADGEMINVQKKAGRKRTGLHFAQGYLAGDFILDGL